jgi:hypothetical protein
VRYLAKKRKYDRFSNISGRIFILEWRMVSIDGVLIIIFVDSIIKVSFLIKDVMINEVDEC